MNRVLVRRASRAAWLVVGALACFRGGVAAAQPPAALAARSGLRVIESRHLTLVTDRPTRADDGVENLPHLFDEAFGSWCRHFDIDPERHAGWRACGCLMVDRERFRAAGLLPAEGAMPDFRNGFCAADRFWMMDQSNPDYRRHLLLHEGVHAFTLTLRSAAAPPWYTEGIAEYLATHRIERDADGGARFVPTSIPRRRSEVEQLGRIERLEAMRDAGRAPGLHEVLAVSHSAHRELDAYAASWAAVAFLAGHPAYTAALAAAERGPLDPGLTDRLRSAAEWDDRRACRDFAAFIADLDYGYDFARSMIDWSPGRPLDGPQTAAVAADRGWQNSGWSLAKNQRCSLTATGRIGLGPAEAGRLESSPDGISLRWYRGRPVGRLLVAQWVEPEDGRGGLFRVVAEGSAGMFAAAADGPLYFKVNDSPDELADNGGRFLVAFAE